jgi:3-methyl-2-oxobutanoate hydroxymethyltransferase
MTSRPRTDGKLPLTELSDMKRRREPIAMVTAYDYPGGRIADAAGIDVVLVGDSAAMTVLGNDSTVPATMEEMVMLTRAAARLKEAEADAVKIEGAGPSLSRVLALVGAGIPVMGHIGLTPQSATMLGGFKAQGRTAEKAHQLLQDARALEAAGCFAIVLEAVPAEVATRISEALAVPTIGIGSGRGCDGQVLVFHDLLGLYEGKPPRFVKRYADLAAETRAALERYAAEVRSGAFPGDEHTYSIPEDELAAFEAALSGSRAESGTET